MYGKKTTTILSVFGGDMKKTHGQPEKAHFGEPFSSIFDTKNCICVLLDRLSAHIWLYGKKTTILSVFGGDMKKTHGQPEKARFGGPFLR